MAPKKVVKRKPTSKKKSEKKSSSKSPAKSKSRSKSRDKKKDEKRGRSKDRKKKVDKKGSAVSDETSRYVARNERSRLRQKQVQSANKMAKQHKQKLLDAKMSRQRERNRQVVRMRRKVEAQRRHRMQQQQQAGQPRKGIGRLRTGTASRSGESDDLDEIDEEALNIQSQVREDTFGRRCLSRVEDCLSGLLYFLTVTLRSERTFDWLVFLANNLGLYQEYEINDYGQRLSPRTGRPVLLSLGPLRVVQVVESANQVRSHWDPYIREYLANSRLTTDCWRANRMALQVAMCMDETGKMFDVPVPDSAMAMGQKQD